MTPATLPPLRSRFGSSGSTKKTTFRLDEKLYQALKSVVAEGAAESQTAFVQEAIRERIAEIRKRQLDAAYAAAAADPAFMADMRDTTEAFEGTAADGFA